MPDIRIVQVGLAEAVTLDWLLTTNALLPSQNGLDETLALVTAVTIAFCTDRLAETSDELPIPGSTDRKGWWGDDGAAEIWNGWPVGSRFWLMTRDKITDSNYSGGSTVARAAGFANECLQPFVDARIISDFDVDIVQSGAQQVVTTVTLYRGPLPDISLQFQSLYNLFCGTTSTPTNYCSNSGQNISAYGGNQTVAITALGSATTISTNQNAVWQNAEFSDLTFTDSTSAAGASGVLCFKCGFATFSSVAFEGLLGNGIDIPNFTGDSDGSFDVTIRNSKFDSNAGWGINAIGVALELSNLTIDDRTFFNLNGTVPPNLYNGVSIASISLANPGVVTTADNHSLLAGDQISFTVLGMTQLTATWYRVCGTVGLTTFSICDLNGNNVNSSGFSAFTSGQVTLQWRPPQWNQPTLSVIGSGGLAWQGLIGTFRNLGFTQNKNIDIYVSENGSSDNLTMEGIDHENVGGKALYVGALVGGRWDQGELLSTAGINGTVNGTQLNILGGVQIGTGFAAGGVQNFTISNIKVRNNSTPGNAFEQFSSTNLTPGTYVDSVKIDTPSIAWENFDAAGQTRFTGFKFKDISGKAQFSISATNTAQLMPSGYGEVIPIKLIATGEWVEYHVPAGGISNTIAGAPLAANTSYNCYGYNSATTLFPYVVTIECNSTATATDPEGYTVKSTDSTRTFIGTAKTDGGGNFQTSGAQTSFFPAAPGANSVTNAMLAPAGALTLKGNATNAQANDTDIAATASSNCVWRELASALGCGPINLASSGAVGSSILGGANGGTGVNNGSSTLTFAANTVFAGAFPVTITSTATTNSTLPAGTHTLAAVDGNQTFTGNNSFANLVNFGSSIEINSNLMTFPGTAAILARTDAGQSFTGTDIFLSAPTFSSITGATQCLHVNSSGALSGTGSDCGSAGSGVTSVTAGAGLSGGAITSTGTIASYFDPGSITDCMLAGTVSGNNLTIALKTQGGVDPTSSVPCTVSFRSATPATGTYTPVNVTAATSVVFNSGSGFGAPSSSTPFRIWVTAWNNAGTVVLGASNQVASGSIFPIDEGSVQSSTACNACATATAAGTFYTTAAQTSEAVRILGYMDWASGLATTGVWASGPTTIQLMGPGIRKPGESVQRFFLSSQSGTTTAAGSYVATALAKNFTKASAANPVRLDADGTVISNGSNASAFLGLFRGNGACTTQIGVPGVLNSLGSAILGTLSQRWIDVPAASGNASAQYTLCIDAGASVSITFPYSGAGGTLLLEEIMGANDNEKLGIPVEKAA
jgi:phage gp46-like protein